jgi:hypothetical protein
MMRISALFQKSMFHSKSFLIVLCLVFGVTLPLFADVLYLKLGSKVEGKIIENNSNYVKIDVCGVPLTYFQEEIDRIDIDKEGSRAASEEILPAQECEIIRGLLQSPADPVEPDGIVADKSADELSEAEWIKGRHGIIIYQDYPSDRYDFGALARMANELGTNNIKTWIKGDAPGEIPQKARSPEYQALFGPFKVICLNICPDYLLSRWDQSHHYDAQTKNGVESDFFELTKLLIDTYAGQGKTFIINYFFEINVYLGTGPSGRLDFPVVEFIADAQRGVKRAIGASSMKNIRILDCIESNCDHDNFHFIKNIFPNVNVDLYSISFYGFGSLKSILDYCAKYAPDNELFGNKNVMVGEYGIKMEDSRVSGSDEAQSQYLRSIRQEAKNLDVPYIFLFWLADQDSKVDNEGSFGLVDLAGKKRSAWKDLYKSYSL